MKALVIVGTDVRVWLDQWDGFVWRWLQEQVAQSFASGH
jgi:hypothetical protein